MYLYVELRGNQFHAMPEEYPLVIHEIAVFFPKEGKFRLDRRQSAHLLHIPFYQDIFFSLESFSYFIIITVLDLEQKVEWSEYLVKHHFINKPLTHKNPHTPTIPCMIVMCQLFVKTIGNLCHALLDTLDVYLFSFLLDISIRYPRCISTAFKNYFEFRNIVACF